MKIKNEAMKQNGTSPLSDNYHNPPQYVADKLVNLYIFIYKQCCSCNSAVSSTSPRRAGVAVLKGVQVLNPRGGPRGWAWERREGGWTGTSVWDPVAKNEILQSV